MFLGQNIDLIGQVKSELDKRVGEFYLAKSRLNRAEQLVNAMPGKVEPSIIDEKRKEITRLKSEAVSLSSALGEISAEANKPNPDYIKLSPAISVFSRMDTFVNDVAELESGTEGTAKGAGIPLEPFNWLTVISLGLIALGLLSKFTSKKRG